MAGKILLLLVLYTLFGLADLGRLKKLGGREIMSYMTMLFLSFYISIDYVLDLKWPFLEDAAYFLFSDSAARIIKLLMVPS